MKNKKKKVRVVGAKLATDLPNIGDSLLSIEINGFIYTTSGSSILESAHDAVISHIEEDREFKENITIIQEGYDNQIMYAPAFLCALGYIDRGDLYSFLVDNVFGDAKNEDLKYE